MTRAELRQHFCNLFRRSNANIGDQAAMQRFWVIEVKDIFGEIGAIPGSQVKMRLIRGCIVFAD